MSGAYSELKIQKSANLDIKTRFLAFDAALLS